MWNGTKKHSHFFGFLGWSSRNRPSQIQSDSSSMTLLIWFLLVSRLLRLYCHQNVENKKLIFQRRFFQLTCCNISTHFHICCLVDIELAEGLKFTSWRAMRIYHWGTCGSQKCKDKKIKKRSAQCLLQHRPSPSLWQAIELQWHGVLLFSNKALQISDVEKPSHYPHVEISSCLPC